MKIAIPVRLQQLHLFDEEHALLRQYPVSTSSNGLGELKDSYCTPRGRHIIRAKIGKDLPDNAILVGRRPTGEIYTADLREKFPDRDWILTRILWLSGCERGFNRLGPTDTMRRYIYIHGSPDSVPMGKPGSHGCIRMRNRDIVELFDLVPVGTEVEIIE